MTTNHLKTKTEPIPETSWSQFLKCRGINYITYLRQWTMSNTVFL